jgi:Oxidoreductase molybdopterin binding domain
MRVATLDRLLAVLVVAIAATGLLALKSGAPPSEWVFTVHGLLGGALLAATVLKIRRSVPPAIRAGRWRPLVLALVVTLAIAGALVGGFLWVASGRLLILGSWTVLTLHTWFGLVLVPLVVIHLLPRRWRVLRPDLAVRGGVTRRSVLVAGAFGVAGIAAFAFASTIERVLGGERRFSGSRWLPSGGVPPPTTFYGEGMPSIDPARWRLAAGEKTFDLDGLRALGEVDRTAVLDCTSGWALETGWHGVPLSAVIDLPARGSVRVRSVTGWSTVLTVDEARGALLATGVAGGPLPAANGAPCRLVVPGRRGLDWVKWVTEVQIA